MSSVMGLDLSLTGTAVATTSGVAHLKTPAAKVSGMERLTKVRVAVQLAIHVEDVDVVFIEGYSYGSRNGGERLGELGGVIRMMLFEEGVPYVEVPPTTLKMYATGKGNADKTAMVVAARERLGYQGTNNDEADALWLRALGLAAYGDPLADLPKTHLRALEKLELPRLGAYTTNGNS